MTVIYKKDTGRLKVAEAKRLIIEAMPDDEPGYVAFSGTVDADGIEHWDIDNPKHQTYRETVQFRLNNSFLDLCREAGFEPHLSIDPSTKGYRLREVDDRLYMVTHAQFVKLAEVFSLTVVGGDEPAATPAPVVADGDAPAIPKNQRPDLLTPLIEKAQRGETDVFSAAVIWPKLCDMAKCKTTPFIGKTESGLQWIDANDSPQFLTKDALGDRLRRQKKAAIERGKPR